MESTTQHWRYDDHIPSEPDCLRNDSWYGPLSSWKKMVGGNKDTFGIHMAHGRGR